MFLNMNNQSPECGRGSLLPRLACGLDAKLWKPKLLAHQSIDVNW